MQAGDLEATERVLQHAWAALDVGDHKQRGAAGEELPLFLKRFHAGKEGGAPRRLGLRSLPLSLSLCRAQSLGGTVGMLGSPSDLCTSERLLPCIRPA